MEEIQIREKKDTESGWIFAVRIGEGDDISDHKVELDKEYYDKLTGGKEEPEELIRRSFEYLLEREPKESIFSHFDLQVINRFFPEYKSEIAKRIM